MMMRWSRRRKALYILVATLFGATGLIHLLSAEQQFSSLVINDQIRSVQRQSYVKFQQQNATRARPKIRTYQTLHDKERAFLHNDDVTCTSSTKKQIESTTKTTTLGDKVLKAEEELDKLLEYLKSSQARCDSLAYIGKQTPLQTYEEGTFPVCFDDRLFPKSTKKCLVYSYGINDNWGFDDGMAELFGCEDHAFDAHMFSTKNHRRSRNVWFHRKALANITSDSVYMKGKYDVVTRDKWGRLELERLRVVKTRTLASAMAELGHDGRVIDVLRLDAESTEKSFEFDVIANLLDEDTVRCVRQLTVEAHFFGHYNDTRGAVELREKLRTLKRLQSAGYQLLDFQSLTGIEYLRENVGSVDEDEEPTTFVMLWGNDSAKPCVI